MNSNLSLVVEVVGSRGVFLGVFTEVLVPSSNGMGLGRWPMPVGCCRPAACSSAPSTWGKLVKNGSHWENIVYPNKWNVNGKQKNKTYRNQSLNDSLILLWPGLWRTTDPLDKQALPLLPQFRQQSCSLTTRYNFIQKCM